MQKFCILSTEFAHRAKIMEKLVTPVGNVQVGKTDTTILA